MRSINLGRSICHWLNSFSIMLNFEVRLLGSLAFIVAGTLTYDLLKTGCGVLMLVASRIFAVALAGIIMLLQPAEGD